MAFSPDPRAEGEEIRGVYRLRRNLETIVGVGLALALGILIGYTWREHLSRQRRAKYAAEQFERDNLQAQKRNAAEAAARDPR